MTAPVGFCPDGMIYITLGGRPVTGLGGVAANTARRELGSIPDSSMDTCMRRDRSGAAVLFFNFTGEAAGGTQDERKKGQRPGQKRRKGKCLAHEHN